MSVGESSIAKEINGYLHHHPDETAALMPLFDALLDHSRLGRCSHQGRCPSVRAGAVLVDEQQRALALWHGKRWGFTEDSPNDSDMSLSDTAIRVLRENYEVCDVWTPPAADGPLLIEVLAADDPEGEPRKRYGFRYLYYAHSGAVLPSTEKTGHVRWFPLDHLGSPLLHERLRTQLAALA
ncbi:NUDIX hydrolase [Streptomyces sp. NPDC050804]|uniref:NUDIX hydrolase n=1 Tax=Streptomyces sp. NPDC050804 TaxID=3154745 RepID=UPI00342DCC18